MFPETPLEQSYSTYISGGWHDDCEEKAGKLNWEITNSNNWLDYTDSALDYGDGTQGFYWLTIALKKLKR